MSQSLKTNSTLTILDMNCAGRIREKETLDVMIGFIQPTLSVHTEQR